MAIDIIAVGSKMPQWVQQGYNDYMNRFAKQVDVNLIEIPTAKRTKTMTVSALMAKESQLIQKAIKSGSRVIALTIPGRKLDSPTLAQKIKPYTLPGHRLSILIGGPDGLAPERIAQADEQWSLSDLTLPHPLVRLVLIEALYRAYTILNNHPYHK